MSNRLEGREQFSANIRALQKQLESKVMRGAYMGTQEVLTISMERVPVHYGTLRASGTVEQPRIVGNEVRVVIGYGGPSAPYAAIVHERLDVHHNTGQAKYLEQPMLENGSRILDAIRSEVKQGIAT